MKHLLFGATGVLLLSAAASAGDDFHPDRFHQSNCTGCHDSSVYTRNNRRVNSLPRLESQVRMCDANLGKKLFEDDILSLTRYLNDNYYHFDK
ncbi:cytochrome c [Thiolapillus sp.]